MDSADKSFAPNDSLLGRVTQAARAAGARAIGVADIGEAEKRCPGVLDRIGARFARAVVIAIPMSPAYLEGIVDRPTPLYFHAYRQINYRLDDAAFAVAQMLVDEGHRSLAIAASQLVSHDPPLGHVSHRALAAAAGIGWIGRSSLLVTPRYGARVRLVSILSDAPLPPGRPLPFSCGSCRACEDICPAQAIADSPAGYNLEKCYAKLTEFTRIAYVGQHVCGVCVKACAPDNSGRAIDAEGNPRPAREA